MQNEEEYENIVSAQANKDYRVQESEGNEYDQAEKYAELSDEEKRKLYEEYMRKYGAQHENEEDIYNNHKEYEKENEVGIEDAVRFSMRLMDEDEVPREIKEKVVSQNTSSIFLLTYCNKFEMLFTSRLRPQMIKMIKIFKFQKFPNF